jgi:hypothetical protein
MWIAALCVLAPLAAQETSGQSNAWTKDINGNRVYGPGFSYTEAPKSSQRMETMRSMNGRNVPIQTTEDKVLQDNSQGKVVERVIRKYDGNGNPGSAIIVHIEEKKNPDGSSTLQLSSYETDINGNKQLFERATSQVRKSGENTKETSTTIERGTINGALQTVERDASTERKVGDQTSVESTTYRRDVSGNFMPYSQEVKQVSKTGGVQTADTSHYELGPDGKLGLATRTIDHVTKGANGVEVVDTDVYSRFSAGHAADVNTSAPRRQEQIRTERAPGPGGVMVETRSVRARLASDPSQFGQYQKVSQTTYTSTDPSGRQTESATTVTSRRDTNGDIVVDQGMVNQTVTIKK